MLRRAFCRQPKHWLSVMETEPSNTVFALQLQRLAVDG
jgi:hypothetical protein